ncbi:MAG: hypothetical protein Q4C65_12450 [Eubacteriales bacterium]|nr:hypothetical protein [Eubacteriales bacterium]
MRTGQDTGYWQEGMDEKRFALCVRNKIWVVLAAALAGALFAGGLYLLVREVTKGPKQYRAEVLYSIVYDIREDDEVLKAFVNEYNAYTWGDMMRSDRIMEDVLPALSGVERQVIEDSISTAIVSDPQFLTVYFTTGDGDLSNRIAAAYNQAMVAFGQTMRDRGLTAIEVWKAVPAAPVEPENRVKNAAALGAVLGLIVGCLGLALWYVLDDSVLLAEDVERVFGVPVLGYRTGTPQGFWERTLDQNLTWLAAKQAFRETELSDVLLATAELSLLRESAAVLLVPWGTPSRRVLGRALDNLRIQGIPVIGVVLTEANGHFLRSYYGRYYGQGPGGKKEGV